MGLFDTLTFLEPGAPTPVPESPALDSEPEESDFLGELIGGPEPMEPGSPKDPHCTVCLEQGIVTLLPYRGRGRKPTKCDEHKGGKKAATADSGPVRKSSKSDPRLLTLIGDMEQGAGMIAGAMAPVAPVTSATVLLTAPEAIESLVSIAARYPKMLAGLETAMQVVPFFAVGKFMGGVVLAVGVDAGRVQPYGLAAEYLRVAEAAERVHWQPKQQYDGPETVEGFTVPTPPPAFSMG